LPTARPGTVRIDATQAMENDIRQANPALQAKGKGAFRSSGARGLGHGPSHPPSGRRQKPDPANPPLGVQRAARRPDHPSGRAGKHAEARPSSEGTRRASWDWVLSRPQTVGTGSFGSREPRGRVSFGAAQSGAQLLREPNSTAGSSRGAKTKGHAGRHRPSGRRQPRSIAAFRQQDEGEGASPRGSTGAIRADALGRPAPVRDPPGPSGPSRSRRRPRSHPRAASESTATADPPGPACATDAPDQSPSGPRLVRFASRPPNHLPPGRRKSDRPAAQPSAFGQGEKRPDPRPTRQGLRTPTGQPIRRSSDRWRERCREPSGAKAQGSIGRPDGGNAGRPATDFAVEQHPEVGRPTDGSGAKRGNTGGPNSRNRKQRREGIGARRRATTYRGGESSEGCDATGKGVFRLRAFGRRAGASWKRGEPHGRMQGATNLQGDAWSKPPKSGRTARAEHVRSLATPGRRAGLGSSRSGHTASVLAEGRSLMNPKRVVQTSNGRTFGPSLT